MCVLRFTAVNYEVTVYTGDKYLAGTDGQVFIELFGRNTVGQLQNSGEEELAGKNSAFEMRRWESNSMQRSAWQPLWEVIKGAL